MNLLVTSLVLLISSVFAIDYCVIGAGPAGIQTGYFLKQSQRDYIILERNQVACSFFAKYPRQRGLISINKRFHGSTDSDFAMRHDWNSLLCDDPTLLMTRYSNDYFPHADVLVKYCDDFVKRYSLNIEFGANVVDIVKESTGFVVTTGKKTKYHCKRIISANGFQKVSVPDVRGIELAETYDTYSTNPDDYIDKSVFVWGKGNSAMELVKAISNVVQYVHIASRSPIRLSFLTHYVGDVRAINSAILDQYQLKSLDGIAELDCKNASIIKNGTKLLMILPELEDEIKIGAQRPLIYDKIIFATGFTMDKTHFQTLKPVFDKERTKYPLMNSMYESINVPDLFFAGTVTHIGDFRKSAGGFIHGFRYTAKVLHEHLEWKFHQVPFPVKRIRIGNLLKHIIYRMNNAASMYQMFGTLGDIINVDAIDVSILDKCLNVDFEVHDKICDVQVLYYENRQVNTVPLPGFDMNLKDGTMSHPKRWLSLTLEYHPDFHGEKVFHEDRVASEPHKSNFLHPIFREFDVKSTEPLHYCFDENNSDDCINLKPHQVSEHHILEDFHGKFDLPIHLNPVKSYIHAILDHTRDVYQKEEL